MNTERYFVIPSCLSQINLQGVGITKNCGPTLEFRTSDNETRITEIAPWYIFLPTGKRVILSKSPVKK